MPRKCPPPPRERPPRYRQKGHDVLLSNWAVELRKAVKPNGDDRTKRELTKREIKDEIVRRLRALAEDIGRIARGELAPDPDWWGPQDSARLFLYANDKDYRRAVNRASNRMEPLPEPDLVAAQALVRNLANQLDGMTEKDWGERLKGLLEP